MIDAVEPVEDEANEKRQARERSARWDQEVHHSGHAYEPTEATQVRRDAEISRDEQEAERSRRESGDA